MGEGRKIMNGSTLDLANLEVHTTTLAQAKQTIRRWPITIKKNW